MKEIRLNIAIVLFLAGILSGCTQNSNNPDVEADIAAIKELMDQYKLAVNTNDMDLFISCWADNAKRMEPDLNVIIGKEKIRERFQVYFDHLNMNLEYYGETEVEVAGDLAYSKVNCIISSSPKEGGPASHLDLKVLDIYKRQADGSWKAYIDCINSNPKWSNDSISPELLKKQDLSDPAL